MRAKAKDLSKMSPAQFRRHRERIVRGSIYRAKYGLTVDDVVRMRKERKGLCDICGRRSKTRNSNGGQPSLHVDHCHQTNKVRGLLCFHCNSGIGHFEDDVNVLQRAIDYLRRNI